MGLRVVEGGFPYFFVGTFIEASPIPPPATISRLFPYFFVGTFIEASPIPPPATISRLFPYFFVGTFIEALKFVVKW